MARPAPFVVGLDTSSSRLAVSLPKQKTFVSETRGDADERRRELYFAARDFFHGLPAGAFVACEESLGLGRNGRTTVALNLAAGAIWAAHLECDVYWFWLPVTTWKQETVGKGNASKEDVRAWVESNPAFRHEDTASFQEYADLYDAWAIRVCAVRQLRQVR